MADCDGDALLVRVTQTGPACHTNEYSCFYNPIATAQEEPRKADASILRKVYDVIADRSANPKEGSYTNYLLDKGVEKICKKIGEEASETIIAAVKGATGEVRYESADLIYHLLVLLYNQDITLEEIYQELASRHKD
jgi:phosphoribosyl-ATP pyrophosphohydrolase/phosphoribosyl-AMP cyclohydrolase